ncbi:MAG TPA: glycosyltransferase family 2 protein [Gemmatimonadaceae bacterium]|nr:glycosyltransferase family 2 protein [Gemmatimonadaceae bacterium]
MQDPIEGRPRSADPARPLLSVVVPVYNEQEVIEALHSRLLQVLAPSVSSFEVVFVNDGSRDSTPQMLDQISRSDPRFKAIHFSRNFGHQAAVTAGLHSASGQAVVVIDADLQDPPELIPQMLAKWEEGFEVVYAQKQRREGVGRLKRLAYFLYYRILRSLTDVEVPPDTGDFCLMDRQIVDLLNAMPERNRYVRGLRAWLGFRQTAILFERPARFAGETKYPFRRMVGLAVDGILSLSKAPLRVAMYIGFFASAVSFILLVAFIIERVFGHGQMTRGWASTIVVILFLGGVQLICLGVIGEFIGRIYDEVKQRPLYVVGRSTGF